MRTHTHLTSLRNAPSRHNHNGSARSRAIKPGAISKYMLQKGVLLNTCYVQMWKRDATIIAHL